MNLRVALLLYRYGPSRGGVERYVHNLVRGLLARGVEVHLLSRSFREAPQHPRLHCHEVAVRGLTPGARYRSFDRRTRKMLADLSVDLVQGFGRTTRQDVYRIGGGSHAEYLRRNYPAMRSLWTRWLVTLNPKHRAILDLERQTYADAGTRAFVAVSHACRKDIERRYPGLRGRIDVVHNGVDSELFHPRQRDVHRTWMRRELGVPDGALLVLLVGGGFKRKGVLEAMRAVAAVGDRADLRLVVVGRGDVAKYRRLAKELKIARRVLFTGPVDAVVPYYAAADVLLLPTRYDPFPNVCLEAMACGLPVVLSADAGVAELVESGREGVLLTDPSDAQEIAAALLRVADPSAREAMGRAARARAEACTLDANVEATLAIYRRVLAEKRKRRS